MAKIRFNLKPIAGNKAQIRAIFQDGTKQHYAYTGETIPTNKIKEEYKYWDAKKQLVRGNLERMDRINALLNTWRSSFTNYKDDCTRKQAPLDIETFIGSLFGKKIIVDTPPLLSIFDIFLSNIKATKAPPTYRGYKVIRDQIEKYQEKANKTFSVSDVDEAFYKHFAQYLMATENNGNKSINRKLGKVGTMLRFAINDLKIKTVNLEYSSIPRYKDTRAAKFPLRSEEIATLQAKAKDTDKPLASSILRHQLGSKGRGYRAGETFTVDGGDFLTMGRILQVNETGGVKAYDLIRPQLGGSYIVRDGVSTTALTGDGSGFTIDILSTYRLMVLHSFLLSCETGLRYSDAQQLRPSHITSTVTPGGMVRLIDFTQIKGSKDNNVPLSNYACSIVDQYITADNSPLFPFDHSQSVSRILKEVFEVAELTRLCEIVKMKGSVTTRDIKPLQRGDQLPHGP